ncbi:MAG: metal ABC transporter ATP-binding protein [Ilumatobacteraceae bacterium]
MSPTSLIELDDVTCGYRDHVALEHVELSFDDACFVGVVGPSGSGKTTLLRLLAGALEPVGGRVRRRPGLRIGYVPQVETIDWTFPVTVAECVLMGRSTARWLPWRSRAERAEICAVLERLGLGGLAHRHIRALSGGQQQRMFLARALLQRPDLLLMDEPTSGVDVRTRHEVLHLLAELNDEGIAMVLTTHDLNGIAAHLPHLVCLNRRVLGEGAPADVLTPGVLEATFGARLDVLEHAGMPIVFEHPIDDVVPLRRPAS